MLTCSILIYLPVSYRADSRNFPISIILNASIFCSSICSQFPTYWYIWECNHFFYMHHQSIGAVNTIVRRPYDRKLIGYNTDCEAAITAIEDALKGTWHWWEKMFIMSSQKFIVLINWLVHSRCWHPDRFVVVNLNYYRNEMH